MRRRADRVGGSDGLAGGVEQAREGVKCTQTAPGCRYNLHVQDGGGGHASHRASDGFDQSVLVQAGAVVGRAVDALDPLRRARGWKR